jgi:hypothetical protein
MPRRAPLVTGLQDYIGQVWSGPRPGGLALRLRGSGELKCEVGLPSPLALAARADIFLSN